MERYTYDRKYVQSFQNHYSQKQKLRKVSGKGFYYRWHVQFHQCKKIQENIATPSSESETNENVHDQVVLDSALSMVHICINIMLKYVLPTMSPEE